MGFPVKFTVIFTLDKIKLLYVSNCSMKIFNDVENLS